MLLPILDQFKIVLYSLIAGIIIGILFDIYKLFRGYRVPKIIEVIEDILFWILCAIIVFTFLLYTNYAFFGMYVYLFIGIGLLLYLKTLSSYIFKVERTVGKGVIKGIRIFGKNISYGFRSTFTKKKNNRPLE
ncbi:spore cortex biosynthesis protein YabQ [Clostridium fallax]|uniref:Spore cortex biosynthesis protein YabQ n=1 Tax=Clostridium fallax TaxID=1533 RepID=A0A1M4TEM5_9CLOT|nr:spore cortex biosynthesis protein YabQ [Clostridium fallax]SHE42906.1 spore cortex biosynthesis protein YabQ [Clostridium fallax]SQB22727.1 spore cortex biosynthesis protein YabQ [Clostridium fallax]